MWRPEDPQGNESGKVRWDIVPYTRGQGLDLGCGPSKAFPHFVGVDNLKDVAMFGIEMVPDIVVDSCEDLGQFEDGSQDFVFSSHLLEHVIDYRAALAEWWRVIKTGGYLVLYLPHKKFYPNVGTPGANPDHKHDFEPIDIKQAMYYLPGWDLLVSEERNQGMEYSFLMIFRKEPCNVTVSSYLKTKPKKTACVVRYGGYGDMLQAACVLPELKRQGFHVTVMTTPRGQSVVSGDPHIDTFFIQDDNQVPNHLLGEFWEHQAKRFDRFINLSESIEGTLLALPGRANHGWPHSVRHAHLNQNYLEFTAEIAGVQFKPEAFFYPSQEEEAAAAALLKHGKFNIIYTMSGSSQHKFYAGQDAVIANILLSCPDAHIFLTGDAACKILEAGWENELRITCLSGEQDIRETLTMAKQAQCVFGPETGVLNAVAFERNVAKVCLLSHSSIENLTKHWVNATSIEPVGIDCYPCHRLHYGMKYCREHEDTGTAMCQMSIDPNRVFSPIKKAYDTWKEGDRESS
jgi:ADP-heptose:LPS heptosyltransferase/predicted SAM-dependent methyltransferase